MVEGGPHPYVGLKMWPLWLAVFCFCFYASTRSMELSSERVEVALVGGVEHVK